MDTRRSGKRPRNQRSISCSWRGIHGRSADRLQHGVHGIRQRTLGDASLRSARSGHQHLQGERQFDRFGRRRPAAAEARGTVRTYFDASFGGNNIRRLLVCNATVLTVAAAQIPSSQSPSSSSTRRYRQQRRISGNVFLASEPPRLPSTRWTTPLASPTTYYAGGAETGHDHHLAASVGPNVTTNTMARRADGAARQPPRLDHGDPNCAQVIAGQHGAGGNVGLFEGAHYYTAARRPDTAGCSRIVCRVCRDVISASAAARPKRRDG